MTYCGGDLGWKLGASVQDEDTGNSMDIDYIGLVWTLRELAERSPLVYSS